MFLDRACSQNETWLCSVLRHAAPLENTKANGCAFSAALHSQQHAPIGPWPQPTKSNACLFHCQSPQLYKHAPRNLKGRPLSLRLYEPMGNILPKLSYNGKHPASKHLNDHATVSNIVLKVQRPPQPHLQIRRLFIAPIQKRFLNIPETTVNVRR